MKSEKISTRAGGMSLLGVLQVVFIVLKLVGVISWSWWVVLIPLWINLGILAISLIVLLIVTVAAINK